MHFDLLLRRPTVIDNDPLVENQLFSSGGITVGRRKPSSFMFTFCQISAGYQSVYRLESTLGIYMSYN